MTEYVVIKLQKGQGRQLPRKHGDGEPGFLEEVTSSVIVTYTPGKQGFLSYSSGRASCGSQQVASRGSDVKGNCSLA